MKKFMLVLITLVIGFSCFLPIANATVTGITANTSITLPDLLSSDTDSEGSIAMGSAITSYTVKYQLVTVPKTATALVESIDAAVTKYKAYATLSAKVAAMEATDEGYTEKAAEAATAWTTFTTARDAVPTSITDTYKYDEAASSWITLGSDLTSYKIPKSKITAGSYYVLWVAVTYTENETETTIYNYNGYVGVTAKTVSPDTGVFETSLYIGVGLVITLGAYFVINKNKERYE